LFILISYNGAGAAIFRKGDRTKPYNLITSIQNNKTTHQYREGYLFLIVLFSHRVFLGYMRFFTSPYLYTHSFESLITESLIKHSVYILTDLTAGPRPFRRKGMMSGE
jgi:hypothetical protein